MDRRSFFTLATLASPLFVFGLPISGSGIRWQKQASDKASDFSKRLKPVGRRLETEGFYVWGASPIEGPDGKIHVFFSRWPEKYGMGWIHESEIAHAVAETPESPFEIISTVLAPRGGDYWDATTCHKNCLRPIRQRNR